MKRFLGILAVLFLVFSSVVFAQQQSTKTLDDIDARIAALGTFSWSAYGMYYWEVYPKFQATGVGTDGNPTYGTLWYIGNAYKLIGYATLTIKWSGVTSTNTIYYDDKDNPSLSLYTGNNAFFIMVNKLTFTKDNISLWGELITDFTNATMSIANKYKIFDMGFNISKIFDIFSLRVGGFGRISLREISPLYPNRVVSTFTSNFRDRGISGNFNTGSPTYVRLATTANLLNGNLMIYVWNNIYTTDADIVNYLGNAQNTTIGLKYTIADLGVLRFVIQQGLVFDLKGQPKGPNAFYTGSPAGIYNLKTTPINRYFVEFRLNGIENLDLLFSVQAQLRPRIDRKTGLTGTGTAADPFVISYKTFTTIDAGLDVLYVLGESMDIGVHVGYIMGMGMNVHELTGTPFSTAGLTYVAPNYTEANYIAFYYVGGQLTAGLYFNYYLNKYTISLSASYNNMVDDLNSIDPAIVGIISSLSFGLNVSYAISKQSNIYFGISYNLYMGIPTYTQVGYQNANAWKVAVDEYLGNPLNINFGYEVIF